MMLRVLGVLGCGAAGAFVGWWVGMFACPDWGDLGEGAMTWAIGGAVVGAVAGVAAGTAVLS